MRLIGARITGQLIFNGATLTNPDGTALAADRLTVNGDMLCRDGFTATGEVRLPGAHITSQPSAATSGMQRARRPVETGRAWRCRTAAPTHTMRS